MLKEHSSFIKQAIALIDCALLGIAFVLSYGIAYQYVSLEPIMQYWVMFVGFLGFYLYFAWTRSLFSVLQFNWMSGLFGRVVMIFISAAILGAAILYAFPDDRYSRRLYFTFTILSFVFIALEKLLLKELFAQMRRRGRNTTPVILFGKGRDATRIDKDIKMHPEWGLRVVRKIDLGIRPAEFESILKNSYVEEVLFCVPRSLSTRGFSIDPYLRICEEMGRPARVFLNISGATSFARWEYHQFMGRPSVISHTVELDPDQLLFKRAFDIVGALVGMGILAVAYPFLAAAIKLTSPGPVFFKQVRVGKNGKRFLIYKFRTMYIDAEERKAELKKHNQLNGAVFKIKDDPRITPVGKFLRRLSLDELPQFINVLRGEMSLVGTRPPTPDEVVEYDKWHHRRISIKPGITGLWQVSGRNRITNFNEIVRLDLRYIDTWSLWTDMRVILRTVVVMFERDQAY